MCELAFTKSFKKSIKKVLQSKDREIVKERLEVIVETIRQRKVLSPVYKDHPIHGAYVGYRECHIKPDVLLLYEIDEPLRLVTLINVGSHSELFGS